MAETTQTDSIGSIIDGLPVLKLFLVFFVVVFVFECYLDFRQYSKYCILTRPHSLTHVNDDEFAKAQAYGRDKSIFGIIMSVVNNSWTFAMISLYGYAYIWSLSSNFVSLFEISFSLSLSALNREIVSSIIFFVIDHVIEVALSIVPSAYNTFVIEEKHGFNKQTVSLFIIDQIKTSALTIIIGAILIYILLFIILSTGPLFYIYLTITLFFVQLIAIVVYPTLIQPCFNTVLPLADGELRIKIEKLAQSLKFPLKQLFVIDGSKRSAHSNAYFYGCCGSKRIVLFDTLVQQSTIPEVVAVLAHELGHWKSSHNLQNMIFIQITTIFQFWLFGMVCNNRHLFREFGFYDEQPAYVGLIIFACIYSPVSHVLKFVMNIISRHFEFQADFFAVSLGYAESLKAGLVTLHKENKATMIPDPLYSAYHHSHPPLLERLNAIDKAHVHVVDSHDTKKSD